MQRNDQRRAGRRLWFLPAALPRGLRAAGDERTGVNAISRAVKPLFDENKFNLSGVITGAASNLKFNFRYVSNA